MLYTIGDLHLSRTVKKPMDIFGARWNGHNEKIEENWRKKITAEDIFFRNADRFVSEYM